ncbi:3-deoxy-D-manno-octulosonic acid transferase [bacterium HR21]|nr:3-deoxy-D-manno-octulosonic acid transferase [bacterium HR21]
MSTARRTLYHLLLGLASVGARLSPSLRSKLRARRQWRPLLHRLQQEAPLKGELLWVHAASAGEFEHVRTVLELLRHRHPGLRVVLTFFSPSGWEAHRQTPLADHVLLLPPDTPAAVEAFLELLHPKVAVFVRYELWPGYLEALQRRGIPAVLVAATFPQSPLWRLPGARSVLRRMLRSFTVLAAVRPDDVVAFRKLVPELPVELVPDPRYDRIWSVATSPAPDTFGFPWSDSSFFRLIAGSTWKADHRVIAEAIRRLPPQLQRRLCVVLVPHEPTLEVLASLERLFPGALRWSRLSELHAGSAPRQGMQVLVVDRVGMLLQLYRHGEAAYVGGGFGRCVHNVVEPAAYGLPLVCGPAIGCSLDAPKFHASGALTVIRTPAELAAWLSTMMTDEARRSHQGRAARELVGHNTGGTLRVVTLIEALLKSGGAAPVPQQSAQPLESPHP